MSQRSNLGVNDYPVPVGTIIPVIGDFQQYNDGWVICNGIALNRNNWAKLFSVIGTQFGAGDGSTTFNVPNLVGNVPKGSNANSGGGASSIAGTVNYSLAETNMPSLTFGVSDATFSASLQRDSLLDSQHTQTPYEDSLSNQYGLVWSGRSTSTSVNVALDSIDISYTGTATAQTPAITGTYVAPSYNMVYLIKGQESFGRFR